MKSKMRSILPSLLYVVIATLCLATARAQFTNMLFQDTSPGIYQYQYTDPSFGLPDGSTTSALIYGGGYYMIGTNGYDSNGNPVNAYPIGDNGYTQLGGASYVVILTSSGPGIWNGSCYVNYAAGGPCYCQFGSSPWYWFDGMADFVIDQRSGAGWPASNIPYVPPAPPAQVYVNRVLYTLTTTSESIGGGSYTKLTHYQGPGSNYVEIQENAFGGPAQSYIWGVAGASGEWVFAEIDPNNGWQVSGVPVDLAISFNAPGGNPSFGPAMVSWNGVLLNFYYTTADSKDLYWNSGDVNGDYTILVAADDSVVAIHGTTSAIGVFSASPGAFDFQGAAGTGNIVAQDSSGNPYSGELGVGMTLLFGSNGPGHGLFGSGGSQNPTVYTYRRPDGSYGWKYTNLTSGVYLVQDEYGGYTAPPYKFDSNVGDTVVNAIGGWPATNLYPQQLYINGIACSMIPGSQYGSGAGLPENGGVSYRAAAYDLTVVLSWYWGNQGFQGFVNGKYGQSSSFKGLWDGLDYFSQLTSGAIVTVFPPSDAPASGHPPQVAVNGMAFSYNAMTSGSAGADVYLSVTGQSLTIASDNTVTFVSASGATFTGTYNPNTHQFNFGAGNTVDLGNGNNAVVTATDTGGHNLTPLNGNTGVTELAGGLDVHGNTFSLGSWTSGTGESLYAFGLAYADNPGGQPPSLLGFSSTRAAVNWLWTHPSTDGGTDQIHAMVLDSAHRVILADPGQPTNPGVILDPAGANGNSGVRGTFRVWERGDISMGPFNHGTQPPVPNGAGN